MTRLVLVVLVLSLVDDVIVFAIAGYLWFARRVKGGGQ